MTYEQACADSTSLPHLNHLALDSRRHFVGLWTTDARVIVGSKADEIGGIRESNGKSVDQYTLTWKTLTIGGGKYANAATGWELGKKDNAVVFATSADHPYESSIQQASDMTVLFYSSRDQRGWLIDGANALVYLARARLTSLLAERENLQILETVRSIHQINESALETLLRLGEEKVFGHFESKDEATTASAPSSSGPATVSVDSGFVSGTSDRALKPKLEHKEIRTAWTYQKLVLELWQNLLLMEASLRRLKQHGPQIVLRKPGLILMGWEARDVIRHRQWQEPHFVKMGQESKQWIKYVEATTSVVLLSQDFGDLIKPSSAGPICESMRQLPVDRGLLAVPLYVLNRTAERFEPHEISHGCVQIHDATYLHTSDPLGSSCHCTDGSHCRSISAFRKRAEYDPKRGPGPSKGNVMDKYPKAAVIIGRPEPNKQSGRVNKTSVKSFYHRAKRQMFGSSHSLAGSLQPSLLSAEASASDSDGDSESRCTDADARQSTDFEDTGGRLQSESSGLDPLNDFSAGSTDANVDTSMELDDDTNESHACFATSSSDVSQTDVDNPVGPGSESEYLSCESGPVD